MADQTAETYCPVYDMSCLNQSLHSNLESFLDRATPNVRAHHLPKTCIRDIDRNDYWQDSDAESVEYFTLGDLWDIYDEASAYGTGVPILLNSSGETVIQYYVPYLSAIQLYTTKSYVQFRIPREESDSSDSEIKESNIDFWSDCSDNDKVFGSLINTSDRSECWDADSEDSGFDQENYCKFRHRDRLGYLSFQYFERASPYERVPLMDKINEFSRSYPELMSLRSVDLCPASWMSVAWYPIYHIPTGRSIKDISACFLTYHTLSPFFQDNEVFDCDKEARVETNDTHSIALPPFGLATYKMQGNLWMSAESIDQQRLVSLLCAADSWLKQLDFRHPDFNFFVSHSM
jgi:hypothetical protein